MNIDPFRRTSLLPLGLVLSVFLLSLTMLVSGAQAAPPLQEGEEPPDAPETTEPQVDAECQSCHLDIANHWQESAHAHAYDDPVFQQQWAALGQPEDCLRCHTTGFEPATGLFTAEGIECEACHGPLNAEHPAAPMPVLAGPQECGDCHTTTVGEWHGSGHATAAVDCMDCHNPHSQQPLFAVADDMCLNCHEDSMGDYLEDIHIKQDIGCVDCHALVIPPDPLPQDGIVPTGHGFTITPATCVACHTDSLHAGFSLPGYEHGNRPQEGDGEGEEGETAAQIGFVPGAGPTTNGQTADPATPPQQQVQVLEAALASQRVTMLFQGGLVGLAFGGLTAWFVASNMRARRQDEEEADDQAD